MQGTLSIPVFTALVLLGGVLVGVLGAAITARLIQRAMPVLPTPPAQPQPSASHAELIDLHASMNHAMTGLQGRFDWVEAELSAQRLDVERLAASLTEPQAPSQEQADLARTMAAIERATAKDSASLERIDASLNHQPKRFDRLEATLTDRMESIAMRSLQNMAVELSAVRDQLADLDQMHLAQWRAFHQTMKADRRPAAVQTSTLPATPAPASPAPLVPPTPAMPGSPPAPAQRPAASTAQPRAEDAVRELSDAELDALPPDLPHPDWPTAPTAAIDQSPPQLELSDDELDALPPELPAPDKPRKRVLPPPKKPTLNSL